MYKHQKKYREAVRFYERVKAKCDLEVSVYVDMAQCYHELGNRVESKRLLFQASKIENASQGEVIDLLKKYSFEEWCVCLMGKECVVCLLHSEYSLEFSHAEMVLFASLLYYCFHFDTDNQRIQLKERFVGIPQTPLHGMFIFATFIPFVYSSLFFTAYNMYTSLKHCIRCSSEIQSVLSSMRIASVFHPNKHAELPYFIMMLYRCSIFPIQR